ncbi:hypothetical protein [Dyella sp. C11]|uniref:hypothetical protein n=1 Tax=Dyella sp. C11 TaxID=2126991 RepID=UPI000D6497B5|nr:hypothetical protein [Dyella sp. C11]
MFLLVWRGWGILVLPVALMGTLFGEWLWGLLGMQRGALVDDVLWCVMSFGCAVLSCCWLHRTLERHDKGTLVIDEATGSQLLMKRGDSFFGISVRWWTRIVAALSILMLISIVYRHIKP